MTETMCFVPRTIESLYKELVEEGLLIQAVKVNLSDYIGKVHPNSTCLCRVVIMASRNIFHLCLFSNRSLVTVATCKLILTTSGGAVNKGAP